MYAPLVVHPGVYAQHVARGRDGVLAYRRQVRRKGVGERQPRVIQGGVLGVVLLAVILYVRQCVVRGAGAIEDGEAVTHLLAVIDHRLLEGSARLARNGDERDIKQVLERVETGT